MSNCWEKRYKVKIVIERIESKKGITETKNVPVLLYKYVTEGPDKKEKFFGRDKAMLLAYAFLWDKLQGFEED